jgi:hypothetical protein
MPALSSLEPASTTTASMAGGGTLGCGGGARLEATLQVSRTGA